MFLESRGMSDSLEDLVDGPFKPKPRLWESGFPGSRFSDGSFPVGYFSLEADTAKAEVQYWLSTTFAGQADYRRLDFIELPDSAKRLFLPMSTINELFTR